MIIILERHWDSMWRRELGGQDVGKEISEDPKS